ncbi:MAG: DpnD protein [Lachnospiraceae bacterium]|nr:DpnD protein [Lachnospiraceae bacterium]
MNKLKEFEIEIKEELSRVEKIEAETLSEAIDIVMDKYYKSDIVLDAEDYKGVDFIPYRENEKKLR